MSVMRLDVKQQNKQKMSNCKRELLKIEKPGNENRRYIMLENKEIMMDFVIIGKKGRKKLNEK